MADRFSEANGIRSGADGAAAGTSDVNGAAFDMEGYDGVLITSRIATQAAGNFLQAEQGEASNLSDAAALAGSKALALVNNDRVSIDLYRPTERYVRGVLKRGTSTVSGDIVYVGYRDSNRPVTNTLTGHVLTAVTSPAEGTP